MDLKWLTEMNAPSGHEQALRRAGATFLGEPSPDAPPRRAITKADLFADGRMRNEK